MKYSTGFLIASLVQAGIIMITEFLSISSLGANFTVVQLLIHIVAGQVAGYILLFTTRKLKSLGKVNLWITGSIFGIIVWGILISYNSMQGMIKAPWTQGISTVLSSIIAFIIYGVISTYTIKKYGYK